jgi:hypothetical protein
MRALHPCLLTSTVCNLHDSAVFKIHVTHFIIFTSYHIMLLYMVSLNDNSLECVTLTVPLLTL